MKSCFGLFLGCLVCNFVRLGLASFPPPIQCHSNGCTVVNYQNVWLDRKPCNVAKVVYPATEGELIRAVADAVKGNLKIKVVSQGSHSVTKLVCPGGVNGVLISTRDYNSLVHVNETAMTVTVDAGVQLRDLIDRLAEFGLTLPHTPYWEGVSMAGLVSTGAHGSGLWGRGSATHDYVAGMRLVIPAPAQEGYARVIELTDKDEDLNAARLSLGVLGAISQLTFALEPMFKRSVTLEIRDDQNLEDEIEIFANTHGFGSINWYPSLRKSLFKLDDAVSANSAGSGVYQLPLLMPMKASDVEDLRTAEEIMQAKRDADEVCNLSEALLNERFTSGDGLLNDGLSFQNYPVVGFNHRIQTSGGCQRAADEVAVVTPTGVSYSSTSLESNYSKSEWYTCNWDHRVRGFFFFDTAISVPISRTKEVVMDIKKLRDANPKAMCDVGLYGGIWLRFIRKSTAYLGEKEDAAVVEIMYYRAREANTPRFNEDIVEEVEQMLLSKYGGKPHLGKNRDLAFEGMESRTVNLAKFVEVKERLDPSGLFSSEWSDAILGKGNNKPTSSESDFCALEGLCVCREDRHCAPESGYVCRQGKVYDGARVCVYEGRVVMERAEGDGGGGYGDGLGAAVEAVDGRDRLRAGDADAASQCEWGSG